MNFRKNLLPIILSILLLILMVFTYSALMDDRYYPLTFVGDTNISFLTESQAIQAVRANFQERARQILQFERGENSFNIDLATSSASLDYSALEGGFAESHNNPFKLFSIIKITPKVSLNLDKQLDIISRSIDQQPQDAKLLFNETPTEASDSSHIQISEGSDGFTLDRDEVKSQIINFLLENEYQSALPLKIVPPKVTTQHALKAKQALESLTKKPVKLIFESNSWTIDAKQLLTLLDLETGQNMLDKNKTFNYLGKIASEINQEVREGLFEFNPATKRVAAFRPSREGRKLDVDKTYQLLTDALAVDSSKTITLPVEIVKPKIETSDVNSLGIKELLGRGISNFAGSIPNRIYNINLAASRINGVLIPPGQTFSFNQTVGDITAATGFRQAYVIKEGRTVLDDGGGVCQDSTTLFRAVLNAGLPVVKRTAHAYRVGYYEQGPAPYGAGQGFPPGLDATVFYPSVDFQFKNDTSFSILVQAYTYGTTLFVDLYGTADNREVNLTRPVVTNQTPPPPDLRQDDPSLPRGTVKQVDWAAWGATVTFKRTVTKNGETIINETWRSNFKPWQAVYLIGTQ